MYVCDVFVYSELSAGGAKQDGCWALLSVGRLWPSDDDGDDDEGSVTNIDIDVGDGGGDPKILMTLIFSK